MSEILQPERPDSINVESSPEYREAIIALTEKFGKLAHQNKKFRERVVDYMNVPGFDGQSELIPGEENELGYLVDVQYEFYAARRIHAEEGGEPVEYLAFALSIESEADSLEIPVRVLAGVYDADGVTEVVDDEKADDGESEEGHEEAQEAIDDGAGIIQERKLTFLIDTKDLKLEMIEDFSYKDLFIEDDDDIILESSSENYEAIMQNAPETLMAQRAIEQVLLDDPDEALRQWHTDKIAREIIPSRDVRGEVELANVTFQRLLEVVHQYTE